MIGAKMMGFFGFCFVLCTLLCGFVEGTSGVSATSLSADINNAVVVIPVNSTEGFPTAAYPVSQRHIVIGEETIQYTALTAVPAASFTGCTRGDVHPRTLELSDANAHLSGDRVMNASASAINNLMAAMEASSTSVIGTITTLVSSGAFWSAMWQALMWDYSFFTGQLVILRILLLVSLSGGFLFGIVMYGMQLAQGLFGR